MHRYTKLLLATLSATALLALTVASASALRISVTRQEFRITWTSLRLTNTVESNTVLCPVTLEGSFHSATFPKTVGLLVGYITRASVRGREATGECTGGAATVRTERLPWHIRYRGYSGTLPRITLIILGLIGAAWEIRSGSNNCSAVTETEEPAIGRVKINETSGLAESLTPEINARIALRGGFFEACALARGAFSSESNTPTLLGSTTTFSVRLI